MWRKKSCEKEIEGKTTSFTDLVTTAAINAVKNEIPNVDDLVKKTHYATKILDIEKKYFTTSDGILEARIFLKNS